MAKKPHLPDINIDSYVSSTKGETFTPTDPVRHSPKRLEESEEIFSYEGYARKISSPEALPWIDASDMRQEFQRCLDMPLRLAGDQTFTLPEEWSALLPMIHQIVSQEADSNSHWVDYNTYLTVDSSYVEPEQQQRHGGLHVDGFQGERITEKTKITRNYVATTNGGTRFYPQRFIVADPTKFNVFQGFDIQAERWEIAEEETIYFMDAYCVHESGISDRAGLRTFIRVTFDLKIFDREGNTHNSMLDYDWDMVTRDVHDTLWTPDYLTLEQSPHFPEKSSPWLSL